MVMWLVTMVDLRVSHTVGETSGRRIDRDVRGGGKASDHIRG